MPCSTSSVGRWPACRCWTRDVMAGTSDVLLLGAVAYDPKVVTIWDGFRRWFHTRGLPITYVLYAHYEHQVEDLMAGHIDVAWNSPLAWKIGRASCRERV